MKCTRSKIFLVLLIFFILGIAARSLREIDIFSGYIIALCGVSSAALLWKRRYVRTAGFAAMVFFLGMWRYATAIPVFDETHLAFWNGRETTFRGIVAEEPDIRTDQIKFTIETNTLFTSGLERPLRGRVLVTSNLFPEYAYGDELLVSCVLRTPEPFEDFAYDKYLARHHIYSLCYFPKQMELVETERGNFVLQNIFSAKRFFVSRLNELFPEPQASFLGGLLYGARRGIPENVLEYFERTGTTHIIAVSGYNITILAVVIQHLLTGARVSRKKAFWATVFCVIFFVIFTGAPASVVRAGVMGVLALTAIHIGRRNRMINAVVFAAAVMLVVNPLLLRYDVGFALSFLATIGLIFFTPFLDVLLENKGDFFGLKEPLISTIAATLFTLPVILANFGRLPVVSLAANLFILPVIPITMGTGFAAVLAGSLWYPLGHALSLAPWFLLSYVIAVAEMLSRIPFASVPAQTGMLFAIAWYCVIAWWMWHERKKIKPFVW